MKINIHIAGLGIALFVASGDGLSPLRNPIVSRSRLYSTNRREASAPETPDSSASRKIEAESNFWFSVTSKVDEEEAAQKVPCEPFLDADGPLPPNAYRLIGLSQHEPVRTCLATVAVDLTHQGLTLPENEGATIDPDDIVKDMHRFIDSGLTTFQLKSDTSLASTNDEVETGFLQGWGEQHVYGRVRRATPTSVLRDCHFVVPMRMPSADSLSPVSSARHSVLSSLHRIGADCIDTMQLKYCPRSPYHLDVLDMLSDLKREGLVRSISGMDVPVSLIRSAEDCGFHFDSAQIMCNLLDPSRYSGELKKVCSDLGGKLLMSGPLAGGLLSERHLHEKRDPPLPWELTTSERNHLQTTLRSWAKNHHQGEGTVWQRYQRLVMETLEDIAFKHEASVSSVSLRWAMQLDHVGSVVAACSLGRTDGRPHDRPRALRDVFRFELDDDDMERLWNVSESGHEPLETADVSSFGLGEAEPGQDELRRRDSGLWI